MSDGLDDSDWKPEWHDYLYGFTRINYLLVRYRMLKFIHRLKRTFRPMTEEQILAQDGRGLSGLDHLEWLYAKCRERLSRREAP